MIFQQDSIIILKKLLKKFFLKKKGLKFKLIKLVKILNRE
jgi:hypothetical protein